MKPYPVLPTLILTALAAGSLWPSARAEEPSRRMPGGSFMLVPFEAYAKHREAIGLSEDQVRELSRVTEGMRDAAKKLEGERRERTEALQEAISKRPIELDRAMERFQAVLKIEDEMKALQFRSGVAAQNLLTPEQAAKVQTIAAKTQGARDGAAGGVDPNVLREKLEQLKGELRKRGGGELSKEHLGALERIEQSAQKGNLDEARKQIEGLLAQLGGKSAAPGKGTKETGDHQPSAAELADYIGRIKGKLADTTEPGQREQLQQQLAKMQAMQDRLAVNADLSRREKNAVKGEGENKEKGKEPDRREKATVKPDGEIKEKGLVKNDGGNKEKMKQSDTPEKGALKGESEGKEKPKFDKNADHAKHADPELRKRVEGALAEFQEAKAAGNREGMEKVAKSIEALLRESAREEGGVRKEAGLKDGVRREAAKDGAVKDGAIRKEGTRDGERKEGGPKEDARRDGAAKE